MPHDAQCSQCPLTSFIISSISQRSNIAHIFQRKARNRKKQRQEKHTPSPSGEAPFILDITNTRTCYLIIRQNVYKLMQPNRYRHIILSLQGPHAILHLTQCGTPFCNFHGKQASQAQLIRLDEVTSSAYNSCPPVPLLQSRTAQVMCLPLNTSQFFRCLQNLCFS